MKEPLQGHLVRPEVGDKPLAALGLGEKKVDTSVHFTSGIPKE